MRKERPTPKKARLSKGTAKGTTKSTRSSLYRIVFKSRKGREGKGEGEGGEGEHRCAVQYLRFCEKRSRFGDTPKGEEGEGGEEEA